MTFLAGTISGIITSGGMGGGAFLILILTNFFHINQHVAQATNLIFFIPTSLCSIIVNFKNKNIKYKLGIQITIFAIIGATFGALLSNKLNIIILRKIFGAMLFILTILEIYNFFKLNIKPKTTHNKIKQL